MSITTVPEVPHFNRYVKPTVELVLRLLAEAYEDQHLLDKILKELEKELANLALNEEAKEDLNKELELPLLPQRIAVISSATAAGYGDFCDQLLNNRYGFVFYPRLFPAPMQGNGAEQGIIAALDKIAEDIDNWDLDEESKKAAKSLAQEALENEEVEEQDEKYKEWYDSCPPPEHAGPREMIVGNRSHGSINKREKQHQTPCNGIDDPFLTDRFICSAVKNTESLFANNCCQLLNFL